LRAVKGTEKDNESHIDFTGSLVSPLLQGKSVAKKQPISPSVEFLIFHRICVELSVMFLI
jgi:hypothetical protein